jgi:hypothetical protein
MRLFLRGMCRIKENQAISSSQNFLFNIWIKNLTGAYGRDDKRQIKRIISIESVIKN